MQFWASFGTYFLYYSIKWGIIPSPKSGGPIPLPPPLLRRLWSATNCASSTRWTSFVRLLQRQFVALAPVARGTVDSVENELRKLKSWMEMSLPASVCSRLFRSLAILHCSRLHSVSRRCCCCQFINWDGCFSRAVIVRASACASFRAGTAIEVYCIIGLHGLQLSSQSDGLVQSPMRFGAKNRLRVTVWPFFSLWWSIWETETTA